jgi:hypothetical protein
MVAGVRVFPKALKYIKNLWDSQFVQRRRGAFLQQKCCSIAATRQSRLSRPFGEFEPSGIALPLQRLKHK